ncbi:hypothetical protein TG4357_00544 [Thalassovita gelatinovora]|uniref:Uncharacterized protein n=1 Tax=Thalassovita gelatinovora TaxID=53501 RepID=A0A0P1F5R4_THAGE|nr:hypothetical protein [Thalassovita gelatinovora]QIZ80816.1 hypothetical protein HFZ77_10190 [Thalassovita gelatinovora]CUH63221.1 hypothetical protein TG4357_00544 [Thalassovita gelatinovora]SEQ63648.1 hypothetical protein SAMN04488043_10746 [Thalassovita gelatinovora]
MIKLFALLTASVLSASAALAEIPEILAVETSRVGMGWRIDVTMQHPDTGWDHFADAWEVLDADGNRLGIRKLMHPHMDEQPFTRSLMNVMVPDGTHEVFVRSHCMVHGWSQDTVQVLLER